MTTPRRLRRPEPKRHYRPGVAHFINAASEMAEWQQDWLKRVAKAAEWAGAQSELPPGFRVTANTSPLKLGGRTFDLAIFDEGQANR